MSYPSPISPTETVPDWGKEDNGWQMITTTLVGLQCLPVLVILYGSIVKKKWTVNSPFLILNTFAAVLFGWVLWGHHMVMEENHVSFWGKLAAALDQKFLRPQAFTAMFPMDTRMFFNFVYVAITLILTTGALLERMNLHAWMLFIPLWLTCSYTIGVYSIWCPTGWLAKVGVMDYSGGYIIHLSSGVAGATVAYWVGPRISKDTERLPANNIILMLAGAGMLWMGWTGFNSEDYYVANIQAFFAVLNANVCATTSLFAWLVLDILYSRKSSIIGAMQGMITGVICVIPVAGIVQGWAAILIAMTSGSIQWFYHKKIRSLKQVDETMAVFHTHAVSASLGVILTSFFVEPELNQLFFGNWEHNNKLAYVSNTDRSFAGLSQMGIQMGSILFIIILNIVTTSLICLVIMLIVPLRLSEDDNQVGNDSMDQEKAHALWDKDKKLKTAKPTSVYDVEGFLAEQKRCDANEV